MAAPHWHTLAVTAAVEQVGSTDRGLTPEEARVRLRRHGPNAFPLPPVTPLWRIFWNQLKSVIVLVLLAAVLVAVISADTFDAVAIVAVLVVNVILGVATELPARRAMDALLSLEAPRATVLRQGAPVDIDARELVPGDLIVLEAGQTVPADARLVHAVETRTSEAALTGEAAPVAKQAHVVVAADTPLAERRNMIYQGTTVADGAARALVVATGASTEVGRIGALVGGIREAATPLERRLDVLGRRLALAALAVAALVAALGFLQGRSWSEVLQLALALGVAAVPEGLPVVATVALAVGVRRMARRRALIRRLATVETLGSTTVVCTDKTGTLTTGEMTVTTIAAADREIAVTGAGYAPHGVFHELGAPVRPSELPVLDLALRVGVLACRAETSVPADHEPPRGDPTEVAILVAAAKAGLAPASIRTAAGEEAGQIPFSSTRRFMASYYRRPDGSLMAFVKGAPGRVVSRCSRRRTLEGECELTARARERIEDGNRRLAARGRRLLALAYGPVADTTEAALHGLTFVGFAGMTDPPTPGVQRTLQTLRGAGIRTVMLTGDQRWTAEAIARGLNLLQPGDEIIEGREIDSCDDEALAGRLVRVAAFSRLTPEAKLRVVAAYQRRGEIVAMLGDGVNDAPALKKADIGVAMGRRGTDVAKATAGVVLQDDRLETVAAAVEEGRVIFDNLRKFIFYLFSCNLGEILVFLGAGIAGWAAPLAPLQILWLNIVTDTFPALALAFEPAEPGLMQRPPRPPREALLPPAMVWQTVGYGALIALTTLAAVWWGRQAAPADPRYAGTLAFMTLAAAQLFHLGNARSATAVVAPERAIANRHALAAVALVIVVQLLAAAPFAGVLDVVSLPVRDWLIVAGLGLVPAVLGQGVRLMTKPPMALKAS